MALDGQCKLCTFCTRSKMERNIDRYNLLPLVPVYQYIRYLIWKIARIVLVPQDHRQYATAIGGHLGILEAP
jgi:hypothetical protein